MSKYDCDTCARWSDKAKECKDCLITRDSEIPTQYIPIPELEFEDDHEEILNALATIMDVCGKYIDKLEGCDQMCPLRRSENEQNEGLGCCSLESPTPPLDWILNAPKETEAFPILLETDFFLDEDEEYTVDTP